MRDDEYRDIREAAALAMSGEGIDADVIERVLWIAWRSYKPMSIQRRMDMDDEVEPRCDICGEPDLVGEAKDGHWLTPDWNGETGNHLSCERDPSYGPSFFDEDEIARVNSLDDGPDGAIIPPHEYDPRPGDTWCRVCNTSDDEPGHHDGA